MTHNDSDDSDDRSAESAEADADTSLDRIVLRASAIKWVWVFIGSMVFVTLAAGVALRAEAPLFAQTAGGAIALLFGFCAFVAVRQFLNPGSLVISRVAIDMIRRGRMTSFAFHDCGRFTTWLNPSRGNSMVVFDYRPDADTELHRTNRLLMGGSRSLTDNYGMSPESLAELLNQIRDRRPDEDSKADDGPVVGNC